MHRVLDQMKFIDPDSVQGWFDGSWKDLEEVERSSA